MSSPHICRRLSKWFNPQSIPHIPQLSFSQSLRKYNPIRSTSLKPINKIIKSKQDLKVQKIKTYQHVRSKVNTNLGNLRNLESNNMRQLGMEYERQFYQCSKKVKFDRQFTQKPYSTNLQTKNNLQNQQAAQFTVQIKLTQNVAVQHLNLQDKNQQLNQIISQNLQQNVGYQFQIQQQQTIKIISQQSNQEQNKDQVSLQKYILAINIKVQQKENSQIYQIINSSKRQDEDSQLVDINQTQDENKINSKLILTQKSTINMIQQAQIIQQIPNQSQWQSLLKSQILQISKKFNHHQNQNLNTSNTSNTSYHEKPQKSLILTRSKQQKLQPYNKLSLRLIRKQYGDLNVQQLAKIVMERERTKGKLIQGKVDDQIVAELNQQQKFYMLVNYFTQQNVRLDHKAHLQIQSSKSNNQLRIQQRKTNANHQIRPLYRKDKKRHNYAFNQTQKPKLLR